MSPALVISKREIRTYFNSPVAYIVVTVFTIITGYLFFTQLFIEKQAEMRGLFGVMPLLFMFLVPAITMRLLAEEKGSGTLELLITMPVRDWEVVGSLEAATGEYVAFLDRRLTAQRAGPVPQHISERPCPSHGQLHRPAAGAALVTRRTFAGEPRRMSDPPPADDGAR